MRAAILFLSVAAVQAGVVTRDWSDGKLTLKLDDGTAEIEWLGPVVLHVSRSWNGPLPATPKIAHDKIVPVFEDVGQTLSMRTKYVTVEIDRGDTHMRVKSGQTLVADHVLMHANGSVELRMNFAPTARVFGLMGGANGQLNLRGEKIERNHGFLFTSSGYGIFLRSPDHCTYDLATGTVSAANAETMEYFFYYGPTAKEIMEQHATLFPTPEVRGAALDLLSPEQLPKEAKPVPSGPVDSWDNLAALVRTLNQWSLSTVIYPAVDLASFDSSPKDVRERAFDLSGILPLVYRSSGEGGIDAMKRKEWTPYLLTYLREAYDRGYPLIRPLPMQFSRDADSDRQADVFMLGDEVLMAPVLSAGTRRKVDLPRGTWTDFRTNLEYLGRQTIEVDAPVGHVPTFIRNGWIVPLAAQDRMELHYFPSLGGEFFLWEPDLRENSQFHASPAGDYVRVEIESKKSRTYEWILHHMKAPREVADEAATYQRVSSRTRMVPGTWWHDAKNNNLHLTLRAEANSDRIVNISF